MDNLNINKYLGQFNPILIVPVLSAVIGAILVFVFGFKRPHGTRIQSSSTDSLKKSKKKPTNGLKENSIPTSNKLQIVQSSKLNKKPIIDPLNAKKQTVIDKSTVKKKDDKKTDEKKIEQSSPSKKSNQLAKKQTKESPIAAGNLNAKNANKKLNKKNGADVTDNKKPADFDDGDWFTVQSKGAKNKNKTDENGVKLNENASPKSSATKNQKTNVNNKQTTAVATIAAGPVVPIADAIAALNAAVEAKVDPPTLVETTSSNGSPTDETSNVTVPEVVVAVVAAAPAVASVAKKEPVITPIAKAFASEMPTENEAIAFDELGEWTDAKPDRKKGNKKKSRKD